MSDINLEAVDTDGAIREAAEEVSGHSRLDFLRTAGITGGALIGGGSILGGLIAPGIASAKGTTPPSSFGAGDIGILNFALTLEYLESAFYSQASAGGKITDPATAAFLKTATTDEAAHVAFLKKALGKKAVKMPKFDFMGTTTDPTKFGATAYVLENTGVHAYLGQAGNFKNPEYLLAAATIVTVEARHAGAIGSILNMPIAPTPFDKGESAAKILAAVKGTGFITG
jgi:hypothetical protein